MKRTKCRPGLRGAALALALCLLCLLAACNTGGGEPNNTGKPDGTKTEADSGTNGGTTGETDEPGITGHYASIVEDGKSDYSIVNVGSQNADIANSAKRIQTMIYAATKVRLPIIEPMQVKEGDRLIVIGTNGGIDAVTKATREIGIGEYGYCLRDNILMIIGCTDTTLANAVTEFLSALTASAKNGALRMEVGERGVFFNQYNWLTNVPRIERNYSDIYDSGDGTYLLHYRNTPVTACDELEGLLESHGDFTRTQGGVTETGNRTATYVRADGEVSYLWQKNAKVLQVIYQCYTGNCVTIPSVKPETGYTKIGENQLALLPLNYTASCKDPTDCSGFSAVMTLEDGRFIVIDGGYTADADALYNYLADRNRRTDGITIAAWVLTHDHGDHDGAFKAFSTEYGKRVNCEYIISNALPQSVKTTNEKGSPSLLTGLQANPCRYFGNNETKTLKMHTGQSVWFCNVELRMLFTHETYFPRVPGWLNETSLVFQLRANGQTTLITGDCEMDAIDMVSRLWKTELKADIYQINHHGYSDIPQDFIDLVDPSIALWPTSQTTADKRRQSSWRDGVYERLLKRVDECIVADGQAKILTLPYAKDGTAEYYTMDFTKRNQT